MLGFSPFASAPFASTGSGAIVSVEADFIGEAIVTAYAKVAGSGASGAFLNNVTRIQEVG